MRTNALLVTVLTVPFLDGCSPAIVSAKKDAQETSYNHLLLYPVADAESLLGREVKLSPDGAWTITDERAPGCEVNVSRKPAQFDATRTVDAKSMTTLSGGYARLVSLNAEHGEVVGAKVKVANTEVLTADLRGPCGNHVVDSVFVGSGSRSVLTKNSNRAKIDGQVGALSPSAAHSEEQSVADTFAWKSEQAYGFTFKAWDKNSTLELTAKGPSIVSEGNEIEFEVSANQRAYVIAYYLEADKKGEVLWPSAEEPEPVAATGSTLSLPSARERKAGIRLKAALRNKREAAREALVLYAFSDAADFRRFRPDQNASSDDGAALASQLSEKLKSIPSHRWARAIVSYTIAPKEQ